jgi:hypothetical protein
MRSEARRAVRRAAAGACLAPLLVAAVAGAAGEIARFEGVWVRDARESDDTARDAEIVRATEAMSFATRGIARGIMRRRMVPAERYLIEAGPGKPTIRTDAGAVLPLDGRAHAIAIDHEVTSWLADGGEIEQTWREGSESHGTTVWRLDGNGHLVVRQRVVDPHFPGPIEYATTYRRVGP